MEPQPRCRSGARHREDAGCILAIRRSSVYELIATHQLETAHIGRSVRIPLDAITGYVASLRQPPA
jgi:excisionase family DNA binding protein